MCQAFRMLTGLPPDEDADRRNVRPLIADFRAMARAHFIGFDTDTCGRRRGDETKPSQQIEIRHGAISSRLIAIRQSMLGDVLGSCKVEIASSPRS